MVVVIVARGTSRSSNSRSSHTVVVTVLTVKVPIAMHFVKRNSSAAVSMWLSVWNASFCFGSVWFSSFKLNLAYLVSVRSVCVACAKVPVTLSAIDCNKYLIELAVAIAKGTCIHMSSSCWPTLDGLAVNWLNFAQACPNEELC